jgi:hypothetical protein
MIQKSVEIHDVPVDQVYQDVKVDPRKKNNDHGIYEVFKGKGITL